MDRPNDDIINFLLKHWEGMRTIRLVVARCAEEGYPRPLTRHIAEWKSELSKPDYKVRYRQTTKKWQVYDGMGLSSESAVGSYSAGSEISEHDSTEDAFEAINELIRNA